MINEPTDLTPNDKENLIADYKQCIKFLENFAQGGKNPVSNPLDSLNYDCPRESLYFLGLNRSMTETLDQENEGDTTAVSKFNQEIIQNGEGGTALAEMQFLRQYIESPEKVLIDIEIEKIKEKYPTQHEKMLGNTEEIVREAFKNPTQETLRALTTRGEAFKSIPIMQRLGQTLKAAVTALTATILLAKSGTSISYTSTQDALHSMTRVGESMHGLFHTKTNKLGKSLTAAGKTLSPTSPK